MSKLQKMCAIACALIIVAVSVLGAGCGNDGKAYKVTFDLDGNVKVYVYESPSDDCEPVLTNTAYSRDGVGGELVKNGEGQVDFKLVFDSGYVLDRITVSRGYGSLNEQDEAGRTNVYRITEIAKNLQVKVTSKKATDLSQFGSQTADDGAITFSWLQNSSVARVDVKVTASGVNETATVTGERFVYNLSQDKRYEFQFTPYGADGSAGSVIECTRYFSSQTSNFGAPRVEINTQYGVFPDCDKILPPDGCFGVSITNNDYVQSVVDVYGRDGTLLYSSGNEAEDYSGAKIKARGNTSALGEKKPYKIKLDKKYDLLKGLVENRSGKSYADKNWVLLVNADSLNSTVGWSVSRTLEMDYTPSYAYVGLFVNGDYRGMYLLAESVEQGKGSGETQSRCAVDDDGFIVEIDPYWWKEDLYFTTPFTKYSAMKFTFKHPDSDDIDEQSKEYLYIKQYVSDFDKALRRLNDYSYADYIDTDSFAKWLLAHELLGTYDSGGSNIFFTKKDSTSNSKLRMSVLWDFDSVMQVDSDAHANILTQNGIYFPDLIKKKSFKEEYKRQFEKYGKLVVDGLNADLDNIDSAVYDKLLGLESKRWYRNEKSADEQKSAALNWMSARVNWLENELKR